MTTATTFKKSILVVEDDELLNRLIVSELTTDTVQATGMRSWRDAESYLRQHEPDLMLLDIRLPDQDGLQLISDLSKLLPVIVLTAYGSIENAVKAIKSGAAEYLVKPINLEELELAVGRALEHDAIRKDIQFVRNRERAVRQPFMVGNSRALAEVMDLIDAVARENAAILIQGESGVGKELVAREIHERSLRESRNFVTIDCCTINENLFESELFGHDAGAFPGAVQQKNGLVEGADGGTLFLDEVSEIAPSVQAKLLRLIETGEYRRLGGVKTLISNTRIIAASNRDLEKMCREGGFRLDLYYRLSTLLVRVPPLRERREDIPVLAKHFIDHHDFSRRISKRLSADAARALVAYDWPGNVRELRNIIERAIIISGEEEVIRPQHLGLPSMQGVLSGEVKLQFDHEPTLEEVKKTYLKRLIKKYSGHRAKLAASLGISERNVYRLIKKYGLGKS